MVLVRFADAVCDNTRLSPSWSIHEQEIFPVNKGFATPLAAILVTEWDKKRQSRRLACSQIPGMLTR